MGAALDHVRSYYESLNTADAGAVVTALVKDVLTPIVAAVFGKPDFSNLSFTIHHSRFLYGSFLNALIAFVSIAAAVFFFVVRPMNALTERFATAPDVARPTRECPQCLSDIPKPARRCAFCTAEVSPA